MPYEVQLRSVPRLKALINRKNISGWQEHESTFTYQTTQLKIPILLHTDPCRYIIMACSVQMMCNDDFDISIGFRFEKNLSEVHRTFLQLVLGSAYISLVF